MTQPNEIQGIQVEVVDDQGKSIKAELVPAIRVLPPYESRPKDINPEDDSSSGSSS